MNNAKWIGQFCALALAFPFAGYAETVTPEQIEADVTEARSALDKMNGNTGGGSIDAMRTAQAAFDEFLQKRGLKARYPLGLAAFFSDGRQVLLHQIPSSGPVSFDASKLEFTLDGDSICTKTLSLQASGKTAQFPNLCVKGRQTLHAADVENVGVEIESLGRSTAGAAWIIGLRPL